MEDFRYSFSGSDARPFAYFTNMPYQIVSLDTMQTLSGSVHEAKGQVRTFGFRGIRGLTRGVRTIAGSMIFIVVNDHPLRPLLALADQVPGDGNTGWSVDKYLTGQGTPNSHLSFGNRLPTLLPPFELYIQYVSELAKTKQYIDPTTGQVSTTQMDVAGAAMMLNGVEFIDSGFVTSVQDVVTEITYSFIARDYKEFAANSFRGTLPPSITGQAQQDAMQNALAKSLGLVAPATIWTGDGDDPTKTMSMTEYLAQQAKNNTRIA